MRPRRLVACALFMALPLACGRAEVFTDPELLVSCGDLKRCGDVCVDTFADPRHCGGCTVECAADQTCVAADCVAGPCGSGLTDCDGSCADLHTDPSHCGDCATSCATDETCVASACQTDCGDLDNCGGVCIDTSADHLHCGFCFNPCDPEEICSNGSCTCADQSTCDYCGIVDLGGTTPQSIFGQLEGLDQSTPSCGFGGSSEEVYRFTPPTTATYTLAVAASFDAVLYIVSPSSCEELTCANDLSSALALDLDAGEEVLVVVDGMGFQLGNFTLIVDTP